ncbi:T3SS (YopN, CesT) and YbjN peptide-binding chaperone 1 [Gordonia sp. (in: high G+C Gram-positive bacteria)]|uniref:T3SS (YopN, CesT) and YbjN peptide-binding chaperone 1 n=1 Tax=Gordonia sp. (in: high G+C Gram-positive bacteria) TaxID=84139 RepID=UPI003C761DCA
MTQDKNFERDGSSDALWADFQAADRKSEAAAHHPRNRDHLIGLVKDTLRDKFGQQPLVGDDGDCVLDHLGQKVWVRVLPDAPLIVAFSRVAHGVYSRRATEVELGILNRRSVVTKWTLVNRSIWLESAMICTPFAPQHLSLLLDQFFSTMTSTRDDLAYRTGSEVA